MNYYNGKVVWITGASSGIGEALANELSKWGAKIILSARRKEELERVKEKCSSECEILPIDLEKPGEFPEKVKAAISIFGRIDILINNAGISQRSYAMETNLDTDRRIMNINFFGTIALTKALLPFMIKENQGHIVTISSVTGKYGTPYRSAYAASKHALHGFFDSLRTELYPHSIKVTLICPGFIKTNITINALTGDGSKLNTQDKGTSNGLEPDYFARKMLKAVAKQKLEVNIGGTKELFGIFMKRFFPGIFAKLITKMSVR